MLEESEQLLEVWRPVHLVEYAKHYEVSTFGEVRRLVTSRRNKFLRSLASRLGPLGYCSVGLCVPGHKRTSSIHRLVAGAFLGRDERPVNHRDGNKQNNRLDNLEYVTTRENAQHASRTGLNPNVKLSDAQVLEIRGRYFQETQTALAKEFGVTQSCISAVCRGKTFQHLGGIPESAQLFDRSAKHAPKFTQAERDEIYLRAKAGVSRPELAKRFNCSVEALYGVVKYERSIRGEHRLTGAERATKAAALRATPGWGRKRLTAQHAVEIREKNASGTPSDVLADEYNVSPATVQAILAGRLWAGAVWPPLPVSPIIPRRTYTGGVRRRLTPDLIIELQAKRKSGAKLADLATEFGVSAGQVFMIVRNLRWRQSTIPVP